MTINLTALSANTTKALALSNLVLISPQSVVGYQPMNPPNSDGTPSKNSLPPSFLFDYEGEQVLALESDITDHFVEDNSAIQDQIALKPEIFTTHGFIGELNDVTPFGLQTLKTAADKLTAISAYAPRLSITAELAYAEAFFAYQNVSNALNSAVSAWDSLSNLFTGSNGQSVIGSNGLEKASGQNKQQVAFQKFYGYWHSRTLFTIQTPWAVFENMAIKTFRAIQDAETRMITDFEVTFKMIRKASTSLLPGGVPVSVSGQLNQQSSTQDNRGTNGTVDDGTSQTGKIQTTEAIG